MELLIPGLILVALMVYASTRIKKTAARAFEEEKIETDDFSIVKPEGFLHPLNSNSGFAFEAYTREFGEDGAEDLRQAWAKLRVIPDKDFDTVYQEARNSASEIIREEDTSTHSKTVEIERMNHGYPECVFFRIVESSGNVYELQAGFLEKHKELYLRKINEMIESLRVK
jgi:hypothetical protein